MSEKTVFISYRRDSIGKAFAGRIFDSLSQNGYDVFLDVGNLRPGKWAEQILTEVPKRSHFILVLTPGSLDRCNDENDWVRREFELAVKSNRNIVPVSEDTLNLTDLRNRVTESMQSVFEFTIPTLRHDSFQDDVKNLIKSFIPRHLAPNPNKTDFSKSLSEANDFKTKLKISLNFYRPVLDQLFTLMLLASVIITVLSISNNDNWNYSYLIVVSICLKGFWSIFSLPKEIWAVANVALIMVAIGSSLIVSKMKAKEEIGDPMSNIGFCSLAFGLGIATVVPRFRTHRN